MEIVIVVIVALCILLTWGPRVLLAIILIPAALLGIAVITMVTLTEMGHRPW